MKYLRLNSQRFNSVVLARGKDYYQRGLIEATEIDPSHVTAIAHGTRDYTVELTFSPRFTLAKVSCNCPYHSAGHFCKHAAAALYLIDAEQGMIESPSPFDKKANNDPLERFAAYLETIRYLKPTLYLTQAEKTLEVLIKPLTLDGKKMAAKLILSSYRGSANGQPEIGRIGLYGYQKAKEYYREGMNAFEDLFVSLPSHFERATFLYQMMKEAEFDLLPLVNKLCQRNGASLGRELDYLYQQYQENLFLLLDPASLDLIASESSDRLYHSHDAFLEACSQKHASNALLNLCRGGALYYGTDFILRALETLGETGEKEKYREAMRFLISANRLSFEALAAYYRSLSPEEKAEETPFISKAYSYGTMALPVGLLLGTGNALTTSQLNKLSNTEVLLLSEEIRSFGERLYGKALPKRFTKAMESISSASLYEADYIDLLALAARFPEVEEARKAVLSSDFEAYSLHSPEARLAYLDACASLGATTPRREEFSCI